MTLFDDSPDRARLQIAFSKSGLEHRMSFEQALERPAVVLALQMMARLAARRRTR